MILTKFLFTWLISIVILSCQNCTCGKQYLYFSRTVPISSISSHPTGKVGCHFRKFLGNLGTGCPKYLCSPSRTSTLSYALMAHRFHSYDIPDGSCESVLSPFQNFENLLPAFRNLRDGSRAMIDVLDLCHFDSAIESLSLSHDDWNGLGYENAMEMLTHSKPKHVFAAYNVTTNTSPHEIIGVFFISSHFPARSKHIFESLIITKSTSRGKGVGTFQGEVLRQISQKLNYGILFQQFIYVTNSASVALCRKLGMKLLSVLPRAGLARGRYTDAMQFFLAVNQDTTMEGTRDSENMQQDAEDRRWMLQALEYARKAEEEVKYVRENSP